MSNDGNANDLCAIDERTWLTLTQGSTEAIVERIIAHYRANPNDDHHPAYALYEQATRSLPAGLRRSRWADGPV